MGSVVCPAKVKLIAGIITVSEDVWVQAQRALIRYFGPIDYESRIITFDFTDYYEAEMGKNLKRRFISFKKLIDPFSIASIKLVTNRIERRFSKFIRQPNRPINIDPGYLSCGKLVLASTKDYNHRIYLGKGIYVEVTLYYRNNSFRPWDWTYPDYKTVDYIKVFNDIRAIYISQINRQRANDKC